MGFGNENVHSPRLISLFARLWDCTKIFLINHMAPQFALKTNQTQAQSFSWF